MLMDVRENESRRRNRFSGVKLALLFWPIAVLAALSTFTNPQPWCSPPDRTTGEAVAGHDTALLDKFELNAGELVELRNARQR